MKIYLSKISKVCFLLANLFELYGSKLSFVNNKTCENKHLSLILNLWRCFMLYLRSRSLLLYEETSDNISWCLNGGIG